MFITMLGANRGDKQLEDLCVPIDQLPCSVFELFVELELVLESRLRMSFTSLGDIDRSPG